MTRSLCASPPTRRGHELWTAPVMNSVDCTTNQTMNRTMAATQSTLQTASQNYNHTVCSSQHGLKLRESSFCNILKDETTYRAWSSTCIYIEVVILDRWCQKPMSGFTFWFLTRNPQNTGCTDLRSSGASSIILIRNRWITFCFWMTASHFLALNRFI